MPNLGSFFTPPDPWPENIPDPDPKHCMETMKPQHQKREISQSVCCDTTGNPLLLPAGSRITPSFPVVTSPPTRPMSGIRL